MKAFLVFLLLAIVGMAAAQRVQVVDHNPEEVRVVDNNPGAVNVVDNNPSGGAVNFVDNNGQPVNVVNNNRPSRPVRPPRPGQGQLITNPDPFFAQGGRPNGGYEPISIGPTFVNNNRYPPKQYNDPALRGGK